MNTPHDNALNIARRTFAAAAADAVSALDDTLSPMRLREIQQALPGQLELARTAALVSIAESLAELVAPDVRVAEADERTGP